MFYDKKFNNFYTNPIWAYNSKKFHKILTINSKDMNLEGPSA
jgi:hypothetical protein